MLVRVAQVANDLVFHQLLEMRGLVLQARHPVDNVDHQIEAVDLIQDRELERVLMLPFSL